MLVLTRKIGEQILVGENIVITICAVDGRKRVRVGIKAPDDIEIHRLEPEEPEPREQNR